MKNQKLTFNQFCIDFCDRLYTPDLDLKDQSTGYKLLRKMVENNIEPFSLEACLRWEFNPTKEELLEEPDIRYLRFLHTNLRTFVRESWNEIKKLEV